MQYAKKNHHTSITAVIIGVLLSAAPCAWAQQGGGGGSADPSGTERAEYAGGALPAELPRSEAPDPYLAPQFLLRPTPAQNPLGATDAYGNAQFDMPERRDLGIFQTQAEWEALGAYQMLNRPTSNRGGSSYFALPGDLLGLATFGTLANAASPSVLADVTPNQRRALMQYGGFGERQNLAQDQISGAFARRNQLIIANMANAPVYRAIMDNSSFAGLRPLVNTTPFMQSDTPTRPDVAGLGPTGSPQQGALDSEPSLSLYDMLRTDSEGAHRRTLREAWALFEEGQFRYAARQFESVLTLDPQDAEARIGEIFSYAAVGALQTAGVLVLKFAEIDENPFVHQVDIRGRLSESLAQSLLSAGRLAVDSINAASNAKVTATHIFLLFYLGEQDAALRASKGLGAGPDAAIYQGWPVKIEAARAALSSSTSR